VAMKIVLADRDYRPVQGLPQHKSRPTSASTDEIEQGYHSISRDRPLPRPMNRAVDCDAIPKWDSVVHQVARQRMPLDPHQMLSEVSRLRLMPDIDAYRQSGFSGA